MKKLIAAIVLSLGLLCAFTGSVLTDHIDVSRINWNSAETLLTPVSVSAGKFGRLGSFLVDGPVNAQPLIVPNVIISSRARDLAIIATMNNTIYAFDANRPGSAAIWSTNFGSPNVSYPNHSQAGNTLLWSIGLGCLSTPAVDVTSSKIFTVCATSSQTWVLRSLSLTSGAVISSVTVTGEFPGTGDPNGGDTTNGSNLVFNSAFELQRLGLTLANGNVYFSFGSYGDNRPWHGWAFGYSTSSLTQIGVWCSSPSSYGAGIWGAGGGFAVDGSGSLYALTGNGPFDSATGSYGDTIIKLSPTLTLSDYFTPSNWATLEANDSDLSSGRAMLVPGTSLLVSGGKDYKVYSVDTNCMGHLGGTVGGCSAPQIFLAGTLNTDPHKGIYGGMFCNSHVYFPNTAGNIFGFTLAGVTFNTTASVTSSAVFAYPGATMTCTSNGESNEIIWAVTTAGSTGMFSSVQGKLSALNPSNLSEYWNSDTSGKDTLGSMSKFSSPTVYNGKVLVATQDNIVQVYGLIPPSSTFGVGSSIGITTSKD